MLRQAVPFITKKAVFVHVSKGIEPDSLLRISEIMEIELPSDVRKDIVVLSGPSHAEEVGLRPHNCYCIFKEHEGSRRGAGSIY
nr:hypothetical protein P5659_14885 [Bacillus subtilis]WGE02108.1 hypothetical protein P5651_13540 [Bacillus subtilis]